MTLANEKIIQNIIDTVISHKKSSIPISMPLNILKTFIKNIKITKDELA
jgi:hypothetical protein